MQMTLGPGEVVTLILAGIAAVVWLVRLEGKIAAEKNAREADVRVAEVQRKADVESVNVKLGNASLTQARCERDHDHRLRELELLVGRRATILREAASE
jgi:hypothetical protein